MSRLELAKRYGEVDRVDSAGRRMTVLAWSSGTRAREEGVDLASIASRLSDERLAYWIERFAGRLIYEHDLLAAEADCRGRDLDAGPLFRQER